MAYSSRRPYLQLKSSQIKFFNDPTRFLQTSLTQESMLEKPYDSSEYQTMHLEPISAKSGIPTAGAPGKIIPGILSCAFTDGNCQNSTIT